MLDGYQIIGLFIKPTEKITAREYKGSSFAYTSDENRENQKLKYDGKAKIGTYYSDNTVWYSYELIKDPTLILKLDELARKQNGEQCDVRQNFKTAILDFVSKL